MNIFCKLSLCSLVLVNGSAWAYGGGGSSSTKACTKPKFSEFTPSDKQEIAPKGSFSFIASANTYPESIKVSAKAIPVSITVDDKNGTAFKVTGKIPDGLKDDFVRISITADGANKCKGTGGWLLKVSP